MKPLGKPHGPRLHWGRLGPPPAERRAFSIERHNARVRAERDRLDAEAAAFVERVRARKVTK